jgi:hypothetical protein
MAGHHSKETHRGVALFPIDRSALGVSGDSIMGTFRHLFLSATEMVARVMMEAGVAGRLIARWVREAQRLIAGARASARGRGAQAKLRVAAAKLEQLAARRQRVTEQFDRRARSLKITERLVSLADPDARPIHKGKLGKPTEFGYIAQLCEVTENTRKGARGLILPAGHTSGTPTENRLLPQTARELERADIRLRERSSAMAASRPAPRKTRSPTSPTGRSRSPATTSPDHAEPANAEPATEPASRDASVTSSAATGYAEPG